MIVFCCSCASTYYVVRHAEKEATGPGMSGNVALSAAGQQRAVSLQQRLQRANINHIYSTNTIRTRGTTAPLSRATGVAVQLYDPADKAFIGKLRTMKRANVLVVGHSNTVDDLVNGITGKQLLQDLPDTKYGDLFIIRKRGEQYSFSKGRFGN